MIRILVVDDEPTILKGFEKALEKHADRYHVTGVTSGEEAVKRLAVDSFDLVFTDLKMPGMDGLAVIDHVRSHCPQADVVMMTGYSTVESALGAMKAGALDYILKPFTQDELLAIVRKADRLRGSMIRLAEERMGFERWNVNIRLQHLVLMITFILLTVTGVPLLFPETFKGVFFFEGSSYLRGLLHRVAAVAMMALGLYHALYALATEEGNRNLRAILPRPLADLKELWHLLRFTLGRVPDHPRAGRFDVFEKFEYFAVVWGTIVMVLSGLILWFADTLFHVLPLWVIDVAKVVHRWEAVLAILSIALWHTYHVHFKPGVFPGLQVWWNGRVSRDYMILHHPLEYEELTGRPAVHDDHDEEVKA